MKKWIKQTIKYILLAMFVAGMLYFNIKDHAAEIFDTLQHLSATLYAWTEYCSVLLFM